MNPEMSRRTFLGTAGAAVTVGAVAGCGWDGGERVGSILHGTSRVNDWLGERLLSHDRLAPKYGPGDRTASFPNYHISRETPILADPAAWRLRVTGLVRRELELSRPQVESIARLSYTVKHHCVEGWSAIATWTGTPLRALAEIAGVRPEARYVRFDSFDQGYFNGWDMKSAMHPETILAWGFNDRPLMSDHGAPLRLYAPHKLGYKLTKYLTTVTFTAERPGGYWEDRGYPWFAGV
ncbi:MAG TPA: molybdopterin-dependent oxidoreductase [Gemmatimonadota bacterium]|nr:molybdopterin-dependent oxidoreductase [Gemmatimonadota bacterium]